MEKNGQKDKSTQRTFLPEEKERFKERLKEIIGQGSIKAFAREAGASDGTIHNYLSGDSLPTLEKLVSMARVAGVKVEWLATGRGRKYPNDDTPKDYSTEYQTTNKPPQELADRLHRYKRIYKEAVDAVGWEPPSGVAQAIQSLIFVEPTEVEQVVLLLEAIKAEGEK